MALKRLLTTAVYGRRNDRVPWPHLGFIGCPLCGQTGQRPRYRSRAEDGGWEYRVVSCTDCGFLYRNPNIRPEHLGDLYATGYSRFLTGRYARNRQRRYCRVRHPDGGRPLGRPAA